MSDENYSAEYLHAGHADHPHVTDTVVRKALDKFKTAQKEKKRNLQQYYERIEQVDTQISRVVTAMPAGGDLPALVEALKESTNRRGTLSKDLAELNRAQDLDENDYDELEAELRAHFRRSWETLLSRQVTQARQIIAKLFNDERVPFLPTRSGYEFKGIASAGKLLIGHAKGLVSPTGFEPVLLP